LIPWHYRNCIFPWGTRKEIMSGVRYLDILLRDVPEAERPRYTCENDPDRW
jgi:hypothetical protein